jgi:predicted ATP-dependent endonuclease of OLD family
MIRIQSVTIEDFRGIRKLPVDFAGRNFVICGPNGSGKSGIVVAIEFAITAQD